MGDKTVLTDDNFMDNNAKFALTNDGDVFCYYIKRDLNNILAGDAESLADPNATYTTVAFRQYDANEKKWGQETYLTIPCQDVNDPLILDFDSKVRTFNGDRFSLMTYTVDADGNLQTVDDRDVYLMSPQQYFSAANKLMASNPSPDVDADVLARFAALNIGSGLTFDVSVLQGDIQTNWKQMLGEMKEIVVAKGAEYQVKLGDWNYFGDPIGRFGTAYDYRAMIALGGLGANPTDVAIYAKTGVDVNQKALNGQNNYVLHFESLPPIQEGGFWSVTAYGSDDFLIANELNRYCINDRSAFVLNEDGSLDIQLSDTAPEKQANWLPVGTGDFHLFLRIYLPDTEAVKESWTAPSVTMDNLNQFSLNTTPNFNIVEP
jgi:Uncharacterized conserved protein